MMAEGTMQEFASNGRMKASAAEDLPLDDFADSQGKQRGINFGALGKIARRNILLISGTTIAGLGLAALTSTGAPSYKGGFSILVEPITSQARSTDPSAISREGAVAAPGEAVDYPTLLSVLQSPEILGKIAAEIQTKYRDVTADSLRQDLTRQTLVVQRPGTTMLDTAKVVEVTYEGSEPEKVQYILQKLADGYLKFSLEYRKTRIGAGVQFIEDQLPTLQQRVNNLEMEMQLLKQRYRITDPAAESTGLSEQLRETRTARLAAQRELAEQQALYANLQRQLGLTPNEALAAASLSENPRYQALLTQLKTLEAQIAVKAARFSEESPVIKALREQQQNLVNLLNQEAQQNLAGTGGVNSRTLAFQNPTRIALIQQYMTATNAAQQLQVRNQAVSQAEAFLDQRLQQFPQIVRQYNDLQQQLEIATRTLNQFLTQRETLRIEVAQKELPWEVISPPTVAKGADGQPQPAPSKASRSIAMGGLGGLALGFAAAMLREKRKNIFFDADDLKNSVNLPFLGSIPFREGTNLIMNPTAGNSDTFSKAFNSLYTNIRFLASNPQIRSVVVSSAGFGDGKTVIALNLAIAAAAVGQRVLVVDANLRNPRLQSLIGLSNSTGLSEMLVGSASLEQAIQPCAQDKNLFFLAAGQSLPEAVRLLASNNTQNLTQELASRFDLVIFDSSDLSEFSDATFLASQADGLLVAVAVGKTKRSVLTQTLAELNHLHIPVLGVIANHTAKNLAASYSQGSQAQSSTDDQQSILEDLGILKPGLPTSTKR